MMIENNEELYDCARRLADKLESLCYFNEANELRSAMRFSTSPTEILGEIRATAVIIKERCDDCVAQNNAQNIIHYKNGIFNS